MLKLDWKPFRQGVRIRRLFGGAGPGPAAALLSYEPGAQVPVHHHTGYELVVVLRGAQRDARGEIGALQVRLNRPGTAHTVASDFGCVALVVWQKPIVFA